MAPLATILVASFIVFAAIAAAPGDPVARMLGAKSTLAQRAALRHELGLDQSLVERYWHWLTGLAQGDLGSSLTYKAPVTTLLSGRVSVTLFLVIYAAILVIAVGVGLGIVGGAFRKMGSPVAGLTAVGVAVPSFVAAQILVAVFALGLGWFPTIGAGDSFGDRVWHLTLPAIALAIGAGAYVAQITRASVFEERSREHVEVARGRGVPESVIFRRHVLRNAFVPIMTVSAMTAAGLIAGAVVVEYAFGLSGLGSLLVESVSNKDYDVVLAIVMFLLIVFVATMALIDIVQILVDPRLRDRGTTS